MGRGGVDVVVPKKARNNCALKCCESRLVIISLEYSVLSVDIIVSRVNICGPIYVVYLKIFCVHYETAIQLSGCPSYSIVILFFVCRQQAAFCYLFGRGAGGSLLQYYNT